MTHFDDVDLGIVDDEPVAAPDLHTHGHPGARDVILSCLAQRLPCPQCGSLDPCRCANPDGYSPTEARADLIEAGLIKFGYLRADEPEERPFDAEAVAQFLADRSGFMRYTDVDDGWKRLMESEIDVDLAATKAMQRVATSEVEMVKAARAGLLAWHKARPTDDGSGVTSAPA